MEKTVLNGKAFIIGGTMKAATTSIFTYLNAHPQICGSSVKETTFFGKQYIGNINIDINNYSKFFTKCPSNVDYIMEASTGYLHGGLKIAKRIKTILPEVKLLFSLREPIDRLYSYYNHMVTKLVKDFDDTITFDEYVEACLEFSNNGTNLNHLKINERHLAALQYGRYVDYIKEYLQIFSREQIKIMFYENLKDNPKKFMFQLCDFLGIDAHFYDNYEFSKVNVTFDSKIKILHKIALYINNKLEPYLRKNPIIKNKITYIYKFINKKENNNLPVSEITKARLDKYYEKSNHDLTEIIFNETLPYWMK